MRIAIHQPNFLPWLGYFYKLAHADVFVLLDDAQFAKEGYIHRSQIKTPDGKRWMGVPVRTQGRLCQRIDEAEITQDQPWQRKLLGTFQQFYAKAPYYQPYAQELEKILRGDWRLLVALNLELMKTMTGILRIETPMVKSSELKDIGGTSTERLISICRRLGATEYMSGAGGKNYQDEALFQAAGIRLVYSDFVHPIYPQLYGEFQPGLSAIDLLFNVGPGSHDLLCRSCRVGPAAS